MKRLTFILALSACTVTTTPTAPADAPQTMDCADVMLHGSILGNSAISFCQNEKAECYLTAGGISCRWK